MCAALERVPRRASSRLPRTMATVREEMGERQLPGLLERRAESVCCSIYLPACCRISHSFSSVAIIFIDCMVLTCAEMYLSACLVVFLGKAQRISQTYSWNCPNYVSPYQPFSSLSALLPFSLASASPQLLPFISGRLSTISLFLSVLSYFLCPSLCTRCPPLLTFNPPCHSLPSRHVCESDVRICRLLPSR